MKTIRACSVQPPRRPSPATSSSSSYASSSFSSNSPSSKCKCELLDSSSHDHDDIDHGDASLDLSIIIPSCYDWPDIDHPHTIPVIDMHHGDDEDLIASLSSACRHWGFFYLLNHGLPPSLLRRMRSTASLLFSLPLPTKLKAARLHGSFDGFGPPLITKFFASPMWSEGFTVMGHPSSSIATITSKLCGGPDTSQENGFRDVFEEYDMAMKGLAGKLLWAIIQGMGVEMEEFKCKQFDPVKECNGALQLNYYPPCPQPEMTMGLAAHTDSTCLTILEQGDSIASLQMYRHGSWISTPPLPGSLVIHVGDMLQVLSNGKYESILHRAITNKENSRLSLAYLCGPPLNATISPCYNKEMGSMNNDPIYKPLTWKEYLQAKSEYFLDALDYFKYK